MTAKRTHLIIIEILAWAVLAACQGNSWQDCDKATSDDAISLQIDKPFYVDKFSNLFSDVRYVALEETQNSIVGNISRLEVTNDGDLIVFDARAGAVFRFTSDGRFLNNVGFSGAGKNEYVLPEDVQYDPFSDQVLVWDNGKRAILCYNVQGELLSAIHLPWIDTSCVRNSSVRWRLMKAITTSCAKFSTSHKKTEKVWLQQNKDSTFGKVKNKKSKIWQEANTQNPSSPSGTRCHSASSACWEC